MRGKRLARQIFDCKRLIGLEDKFVLHTWTIYLMIEALVKFLLFNTDIFGHFCSHRGLTSVYSVMYSTIGIACVYFWYLFDHTDAIFKLEWLYKAHLYTLIIAVCCYGLDALMWKFDKK